jgi:hypothetical protein
MCKKHYCRVASSQHLSHSVSRKCLQDKQFVMGMYLRQGVTPSKKFGATYSFQSC